MKFGVIDDGIAVGITVGDDCLWITRDGSLELIVKAYSEFYGGKVWLKEKADHRWLYHLGFQTVKPEDREIFQRVFGKTIQNTRQLTEMVKELEEKRERGD